MSTPDKMNSEKFYRQFILETSRSQKHRGVIGKGLAFHGTNPSCGDDLTIYLQTEGSKITDTKFTGFGCAISMASAHFLCESLTGKDLKAAKTYVQKYLDSLDSGASNQTYAPFDSIPKTAPARVKCARLAWETVEDSFFVTPNFCENYKDLE